MPFSDNEQTPYVRLDAGTHHEVHALDSRAFRTWLEREHYAKFGAAPASAIDRALEVLSGKARFEGEVRSVAVRLSGDEDAVYLDLGDPAWQVVRVSAEGWKIISDPPMLFRRPKGFAPLPIPERGGTVNELRGFLNVTDEDQFRLIVGFLLGALRARAPYPMLELTGAQGSAKSTTAKMLRQLIDPNSSPARAPFPNERDLALAAHNGWLLVFDNFSRLSAPMSDALCRTSTGNGFSTRKLYSNDEEQTFNFARPVILNGIEDIATRPDLLERTISVELAKISPARRRAEDELWKQFDVARPRLLGALLDAVAGAMKHIDSIPAYEWPRLADFAKWVTAAESTLGWKSGSFLGLLERSRLSSNQRALEEHESLIEALRKVMEGLSGSSSSWTGTASDLLAKLKLATVPDLPRGANGLSGLLRRLQPALGVVGLDLSFDRQDCQRFITISRSVPSGPGED